MQTTEAYVRKPLSRLLERLAQAHTAGQTVNLERLQADQPDLLPELARELAGFSLDTIRAPETVSLQPDIPSTGVVPVPSRPGFPSIPGYEVTRLLGRGGMGVVYEARHLALGRTVAIKMILPHGPAEADELKRFRQEAEAVAQLQHPNIVQIFEIGEAEGRPWFALEYLGGGNLDRQLEGRPQSPQAAAQLVRTLAQAMQACHDRGIIHRDLKPANILLAGSHSRKPVAAADRTPPLLQISQFDLASANPKIGDFGLARNQDSELTKTGAILGTPSYMAPEQAAARVADIGPCSDQYALGAILYQLLTGRPPFLGPNPYETVALVLGTEPTPPRRLVPTVPLDLETICLKALQKEPGKRYPSCSALADDLSRFLAHEPILARPISTWERLWRWRKRNPLAAGLLATVAATLLLGIAVSTTFALLAYHRANTIASINKDLVNANQQKTKALDDARAKTRLAEDRTLVAVNTLKSVIFEIQDKLTRIPAAQTIRGNLLKTALAGLQKVTGELTDQKDIDRATAIAMLNLAGVFAQVGNEGGFKGPSTAQGMYDTVVQRLEELLAADPDSVQAMKDLAGACVAAAINLEHLDEAGRETSTASAQAQSSRPLMLKAKALHARSVELRRRIAKGPTDPRASFNLAEALADRAMLEIRAGDAQLAKALLEESIALSRRLVAEHPKEVDYRATLAKGSEMLGDWHFDLKEDFDQAGQLYEVVVSETGVLAKENPDDAVCQVSHANAWSRLADVHGQRSALLLKKGERAAGLAEKEKELACSKNEVAITDKLMADAPDNVRYLTDAAISYDHLARGYFTAERYAEALPILRKAFDLCLRLIDFDKDSRRHHVHLLRRTSRLAVSLAKLNQPAEAMKVYEEGIGRLRRYMERTGEHSIESEVRQLEQARDKLRGGS